MAVTIIQNGQLPEEEQYRSTCNHCKTVFEYLRKDATYWSSCRNEEGLKIPCPLCKRDVYRHL